MSTTDITGEKLLTLNELAGRLDLHPSTVRRLWRARRFPGIWLGHRTLRFDWPAVLAALDHRQARS